MIDLNTTFVQDVFNVIIGLLMIDSAEGHVWCLHMSMRKTDLLKQTMLLGNFVLDSGWTIGDVKEMKLKQEKNKLILRILHYR